jgi:hypothetical protein
MSMEYIRSYYGVPAQPGGRVRYSGGRYPMEGTIDDAQGAYLMIRLDGQRHAMPYHPTWKIEYLPEETNASSRPEITHDADCLSFFIAHPGPCDCSASRNA